MSKEINRLREALDRIARPLYWITKDAEKDGYRINGAMALALSTDPEYLKEIARKALEIK